MKEQELEASFRLTDFVQPPHRDAFDALPPVCQSELIRNLRRLAGVLQILQDRMGRPVGVVRCWSRGASNTQYADGTAAEVVVEGVTPWDALAELRAMQHTDVRQGMAVTDGAVPDMEQPMPANGRRVYVAVYGGGWLAPVDQSERWLGEYVVGDRRWWVQEWVARSPGGRAAFP